MAAATAHPSARLSGDITVPGDKSISHRALMFAGLAIGRSRISGLLEGEDVVCTAEAMRAFGATVERRGDSTWEVDGVGVGGLMQPDNIIDLGNSGTGARLLAGLAASHPITTMMTGDASLRKRPMGRITRPLQQMGAEFVYLHPDRLPMAVIGSETPLPIAYEMPVASAQVKSAVLLAALNAPGTSSVLELVPTRDHTETMLRHFGADIYRETDTDSGRDRILLTGQPELQACDVAVPGDISSAAFPLVAALLCAGSEIRLRNIGLNPTRTGLLECLREMGADIVIENERRQQGEPMGDLVVKTSQLSGIDVPRARTPRMIDEYPILAMAAACAEGKTVLRGAEELRVKESDRIAMVAQGLRALGADVTEYPDGLEITGTGGPPPARNLNAPLATALDHRIAMSFLIFGLAARMPVTIDDASVINTSFPGFSSLMTGLGAKIDSGRTDAPE